MGDNKKENLVKQPEVSKLHVMELVQFMARPLKQLEEQFRDHCKECIESEKRFDRVHERIESALVQSKEDAKRLDEEVQRAKSEANRAMSEAGKNKQLPEEIVALQEQIALMLEKVEIGESVRLSKKPTKQKLIDS